MFAGNQNLNFNRPALRKRLHKTNVNMGRFYCGSAAKFVCFIWGGTETGH